MRCCVFVREEWKNAGDKKNQKTKAFPGVRKALKKSEKEAWQPCWQACFGWYAGNECGCFMGEKLKAILWVRMASY